MKPTVYLAGAIRDGRQEDIAWRDGFVHTLAGLAVVWNPLAGKHYDEATRSWTLEGRTPHSRMIVHQDFWCVDRADIIVFNLLPMAEGYPSIGTVSEWGRSTARSVLRYVIAPSEFKGHSNAMFPGLHPFFSEYATEVFEQTVDCLWFLERMLPHMTGEGGLYVP